MIRWENAVVNTGNPGPLATAMDRAARGEELILGFIGGSITMGCHASNPENCYAHLVYQWFAGRFPKVRWINAGIGATTSQFGVARVAQDLLRHKPHIVFVEFSVNDENTSHFRETYEGLIRRILKSGAAVVGLHNICYDTGASAEDVHLEILRHYEISAVSVRPSLYRLIQEGKLPVRSITEDDLHPNDLGHWLLAGLLTGYLESIPRETKATKSMPPPLTRNRYENSLRLDQRNAYPELLGFIPDTEPQNHLTEVFRNGYIGRNVGDALRFSLRGSVIAVQYRKTIRKPAPIALAILDGNESGARILDANFQEDWGDCLYTQTLIAREDNKLHTLEIRIISTEESAASDFYLASVIQSSQEE